MLDINDSNFYRVRDYKHQLIRDQSLPFPVWDLVICDRRFRTASLAGCHSKQCSYVSAQISSGCPVLSSPFSSWSSEASGKRFPGQSHTGGQSLPSLYPAPSAQSLGPLPGKGASQQDVWPQFAAGNHLTPCSLKWRAREKSSQEIAVAHQIRQHTIFLSHLRLTINMKCICFEFYVHLILQITCIFTSVYIANSWNSGVHVEIALIYIASKGR